MASSPSPSNHRKNKDVAKLISSHEVTFPDHDELDYFVVKFVGPKDTPYDGGVWNVDVLLPKDYPSSPPRVGFINKIYHPNIVDINDFLEVCLDVIDDGWKPTYNLNLIFDYFLPQLLADPNPEDPMDSEAALLLINSPEAYKEKVKDYVRKYASVEGPYP